MNGTVLIWDESAVAGGRLAEELICRGMPAVCCRERLSRAEERIAELSPKAVIIIVYSYDVKQLGMLKELNTRFTDVKFVTGVFGSLNLSHRIFLEAGAVYSFSVPSVSDRVFAELMRALIRENVSAALAEDFLYRCGFNDKSKGFGYFASAMDICISDVRLLSGGVTDVYSRVAELFHTKAGSVERDMRTFIAMPKQSRAVARIRFGRTKSAQSNREMIAMACDAFVGAMRTAR